MGLSGSVGADELHLCGEHLGVGGGLFEEEFEAAEAGCWILGGVGREGGVGEGLVMCVLRGGKGGWGKGGKEELTSSAMDFVAVYNIS